jgi:hypothetical protein
VQPKVAHIYAMADVCATFKENIYYKA